MGGGETKEFVSKNGKIELELYKNNYKVKIKLRSDLLV